mmetsp:Transcript_11253/g.28086  ORF Transcript_11253/g.28086 Transcript_11253/m.28086 type:complete len:216 (+) Transcript_11253:366-1013(+)
MCTDKRLTSHICARALSCGARENSGSECHGARVSRHSGQRRQVRRACAPHGAPQQGRAVAGQVLAHRVERDDRQVVIRTARRGEDARAIPVEPIIGLAPPLVRGHPCRVLGLDALPERRPGAKQPVRRRRRHAGLQRRRRRGLHGLRVRRRRPRGAAPERRSAQGARVFARRLPLVDTGRAEHMRARRAVGRHSIEAQRASACRGLPLGRRRAHR